jgi:carbon-monoxide dehydrogenase large subunit
VILERMVSVDDAGTVINPLLVEGQLHGGIAQGIGQALYEEFVYDADGNPLTGSFLDYAIPSAAEMPSFDVHVVQYPSPNNPLGVKGIAESGCIGAVPAIQNAVIDALADRGVRHLDMPITPQRVWAALGGA